MKVVNVVLFGVFRAVVCMFLYGPFCHGARLHCLQIFFENIFNMMIVITKYIFPYCVR